MTNTKFQVLITATILAFGALSVAPAKAEMGPSPIDGIGSYFTLFGGYVNSDGTATPGHGVNPVPQPTLLFEVENGGFAGISGGYVFADLGPFGLSNFRIETGFTGYFFEDDKGSLASGSLINLGGNAGSINQSVASQQTREVYDWSMSIKGDKRFDAGLNSAFGLEFFLRQSEDETTAAHTSGLFPGRFRKHDVDGLFIGGMASVQPEFEITPELSFVAELGAGIYNVSADAQSTVNFSAPRVFNDSEDAVGFRAKAKGGLQFQLNDSLSLSVFGGVDYWSDIPVANQVQARGVPNDPLPTLKFNSLVELQAGISLTFLLN